MGATRMWRPKDLVFVVAFLTIGFSVSRGRGVA